MLNGSATFGKISIGDPTSTVRAINLRGTATAQIGLQDDASTNFRHDIGSWATGSGNFVIQHSTSGIGVQLTGSGATSWSSFSDLRLKDVTGGFVEALDDVKQLEPIRFTWKSDDSKFPLMLVFLLKVCRVFCQRQLMNRLCLRMQAKPRRIEKYISALDTRRLFRFWLLPSKNQPPALKPLRQRSNNSKEVLTDG